MLPRFHAKDFLTVGHYLGVLLVITGSLMFVPVLVAAVFDEQAQIPLYMFGAGATLLAGSLLRLLKAARLDRRRSLLLCGFGWIVVAFFAAIPLYLSDEFSSFLNAFFDSVSMLTSTGVTSLTDVEHISHAQSTWCTILSLAGGQAIIITALYLGFFGDGGYSARDNARARRDSITAALRNTGKLVWRVMAGIVVVGMVAIAVILAFDGMPVLDAVVNGFWLSGNSFSTGSFVPHNSSLIFYHSPLLNSAVAVLMILGSLNFAVFALAVSSTGTDFRDLIRKNSELRSYALWLLLLVVAVTAIICREGIFSGAASLFSHSTFMVISAATTSGMQTVYPGQMGESFPDGALIIIMAAMFIGGCSCSTAGGLKMFRALQVLRWFGQSVQRSLFPDSVQVYARYNHFGVKRATSADAMLAMVVTTLFIIAAALGAAVFIAHGYGAVDAICESISYVTNTGIAVELPASSMDADLMVISMLMMWAGRLEFIALIAALASVVTSARPQRNVIPDGVVNSRKAQRNERRRRRMRRLRAIVLLEKSKAKVLPLLLVVCLSVCAIGAPQAHAAYSPGFSVASGGIVQSYRDSTVRELQSATSRMDGDYVKITGEVVGYAVKADSRHVWLNVQDDTGAVISVYASRSLAKEVSTFGGYAATGDMVEIKGVYNQACKRHAGELEIHATSLALMQAGAPAEHTADYTLALTGVLMLLISFILVVAERLWRGERYVRILGRKL